MQFEDTDLDQSYFQPVKNRVDQTMGYFLMVMMVVLVFSLFVMAIINVQSVATQSTTETPRNVTRTSPDIGDVNLAEPANDSEPSRSGNRASQRRQPAVPSSSMNL